MIYIKVFGEYLSILRLDNKRGEQYMIRKDICDCINSEDKEPLMLALNESIRREEEQIIKFKTDEDKVRKLIHSEKDKSAFYDIVNLSDKVQRLHEYTINYYNKAKTKLENTKLCDNNV